MSGPDPRLRAYLLGRLGPDEAEALEREYFTDPARRERLEVEEDELFDDYARGRLSAPDCTRFEATYLSSPEGRQRAALAAALRARTTLPGPRREMRPAWPRLSAAAVLAAAALSGWWAYRQTVQEVPRRDAEPSSRPSEPGAGPGEAAAGAGGAPAGAVHGVVTRLVAPGLQRAGEPAPTVELRPDTRTVRLRLRARREWDYVAYEARIESAAGRELARAKAGPASTTPDGRVVEVTFPVSSLAEGTCVLMLQGRTSRLREDLASYVFRVARRD